MPWKEVSLMSQRKELVMLSNQPGINKSELCRRYGISRKTGHKWVQRYHAQGEAGLQDQPRTPHHTPDKTAEDLEQLIVALRDQCGWGGRKLHRRLCDLGYREVPHPSTITSILKRHGRIFPLAADGRHVWQRFEHAVPNQLWQMDFKGHFAMQDGRCHPLTVLDDHSRFALSVQACANEQGQTVRAILTQVFQRYGLPERMTMDNGPPWGSDRVHVHTPLTVWLLRLGIGVSHSRPYHPQTQGKDERFHRPLNQELLCRHTFQHLAHCQAHFDRWRYRYNFERPHEALQMNVPASRYRPSPRSLPAPLPPIEYAANSVVRKVQEKGHIHFQGRVFSISKAFKGYPVALQPMPIEGMFAVYFCTHKVTEIDIRTSV